MPAMHLLVSGVVQGVGYRAWTERTARTLGLSGWVRNLADGSVEIFVEGEDAALATLEQRCWEGPSGAEVNEVTAKSRAPRNSSAFRVERSALEPDSGG